MGSSPDSDEGIMEGNGDQLCASMGFHTILSGLFASNQRGLLILERHKTNAVYLAVERMSKPTMSAVNCFCLTGSYSSEEELCWYQTHLKWSKSP